MDRLNSRGRNPPRTVLLLLCLGAFVVLGFTEKPKEEVGLVFDEPAG
jgi:hypothetical protein